MNVDIKKLELAKKILEEMPRNVLDLAEKVVLLVKTIEMDTAVLDAVSKAVNEALEPIRNPRGVTDRRFAEDIFECVILKYIKYYKFLIKEGYMPEELDQANDILYSVLNLYHDYLYYPQDYIDLLEVRPER